MARLNISSVLVLVIYSVQIKGFVFDDLFSWGYNTKPSVSQESNEVKEPISLREGVSLFSVPYEELSLEDKFLLEAEKFSSISLSGLDTCEHRVILELKTSCSQISEEDLAKLSIRLLNCQSEVSGRKQIVCTDEMSLSECTSPMSSEVWNAYHVINNRARAVCYALRQQQFQALSDMTVNKLMTTALRQLSTMDELEGRQKDLSEQARDTVSSLRESQLTLMNQGSGLQLGQQQLRADIAHNLRQLIQEKTVIQTTHSQLRTLAKKLTDQLENMRSQLNNEGKEQETIHQELLSNLVEITAKTEEMWAVLDEKTNQLQQKQDVIYKSTTEAINNFKTINNSLNALVNLVNKVKTEVDETISWANSLVGGDGAILLLVVQHVGFLVVGVIVSLFIQLTLTYRLVLLVSVLTNIVLVYKSQQLDFIKLPAVITGLWFLCFLIPMCWSQFKKFKSSRTVRSKQANTSHKKESDTGENEEDKEEPIRSSLSTYNYSRNLNGSVKEDDERESSVASSIRQRITASVERRVGSTCAAKCRNGQLCRATPTPGHLFCHRHLAH